MHYPVIIANPDSFVYENQSFELNCYIKVGDDIIIDSIWYVPNTLNMSRIKVNSTIRMVDGYNQTKLTVSDAKLTDTGNYSCLFIDDANNTLYASKRMEVVRASDAYLFISEPNNNYNIDGIANETIIINVTYSGYPWPKLHWYRHKNYEIASKDKRLKINTTNNTSILEIVNAQISDSGHYKIIATNSLLYRSIYFNVTVLDVPVISVENVYVMVGEETEIVCKVLSIEPPKVYWTLTFCENNLLWPTCSNNNDSKLNSSRVEKGPRNFEYIHYLKFKPSFPGVVRCFAQNDIGKGEFGEGRVILGDITDNITIYGIDENEDIVRGDDVNITCAALNHFYTEIKLYNRLIELKPINGFNTNSSKNEYSIKKTIRFENISNSDGGMYICYAYPVEKDDPLQYKTFKITVNEPYEPRMKLTNLSAVSIVEVGQPLELICNVEGRPRPHVQWYRDEVKLNATENKKIGRVETNSKLIIKQMLSSDEGLYKCIASNRIGEIESSVIVEFKKGVGWTIIIIVFIVLLLGLVVFLGLRVHRERKLLRELKEAGLENFEEGAIDLINPELTLDEQAELLPYDRYFEFPRNKLKLGKQLGAGAFGVVLKAHAEGIKPEEEETVVAVKMVKKTADNEIMRTLVMELKIMIHLGQHLNVVNLLGAVTKNIVKKELMVIVEFCRYGNVQNVLMKNRKYFIDQINPETEEIDPTINCSYFSDANRNSASNARPSSSAYCRRSLFYERAVESNQTVAITACKDNEIVHSYKSVRPFCQPDSNEAITLTTTDLISWAFQVARGMDYLSSKRVLHGDLAARNILLCEDNVVKICDFGLARTLYKNNNYKKHKEERLPLRWLALESLTDSVFSTYTDVWSFGIVLWEFFSLAQMPYTGMDANHNWYLKLKGGYRMEKPQFANDEVYETMLECWSANPESRPLFNDLEKRFARMLGDEVSNRYLELNEPYLRNKNDYKPLSNDYLKGLPRSPLGYVIPEMRIKASSDDYILMEEITDKVTLSPTRPNESQNIM